MLYWFAVWSDRIFLALVQNEMDEEKEGEEVKRESFLFW